MFGDFPLVDAPCNFDNSKKQPFNNPFDSEETFFVCDHGDVS